MHNNNDILLFICSLAQKFLNKVINDFKNGNCELHIIDGNIKFNYNMNPQAKLPPD